ncbi:MAG: alkaline phosphatase D family protein [Microscillaceae bacterium]|jgi:hypothetical protein|nr:alkaline phosphatase D family protein [Microscillaceae bacterium]
MEKLPTIAKIKSLLPGIFIHKKNAYWILGLMMLGLGLVGLGSELPWQRTWTKIFLDNKTISYIWVGAVTPTTAKVKAKVSDAATVRLVLSTLSNFSNPIYGDLTTVDASTNYMADLSITGLTENTRYFYAVEVDGEQDATVGRFFTVSYSAHSYNFVVSACATSSNHIIFPKMDSLAPQFYLNTGDLHYTDPNSSDVNAHRQPYEVEVLSKTRAANFFKRRWFAYMWDDHDYSGDGSDSLSPGRASARQAYREYVPHFALPAGNGDRAIYQAFTIGRVRYIMTDLRSTKVAGTQHMSPTQKTWFKNEVLQAKLNKQMIFWISPVSYSGEESDNWGGYATERTELADFFRANHIQNMLIICGDAHMVAIDNGDNSDFSTQGNSPYKYPILQAAAFNRAGSNKGGTYSEGTFLNPAPNTGQFVEVKVIDEGGDSLYVDMTGIRVTVSGAVSTLVNYKFGRDLSGNITLPIRMAQFRGQAVSSRACQLVWTLADTQGMQAFGIEKSSNGRDFKSIGKVPLKTGLWQNYNFTDELFEQDSYYRIKIYFEDGQIDYSQWIFVRKPNAQAQKFLLYPNPNPTRKLGVLFAQKTPEFTFELLDINGKILYINTLYPQQLRVELDLPTHIAAGNYLYRIKSASGVYNGRVSIL